MLITIQLMDINKLGPERARAELDKALSWRGEIVKVKESKTPDTLLIEIKVTDSWQATDNEKLAYLKDWLTVKTRFFTVKDVRG